MNDQKVIGGIALLTVLILGGVVFFGGKSGGTTATTLDPIPTSPGQLTHDYSPQVGSADAKVTIVEFGDFQCPACGLFAPTLEKVISTYGDRVHVVFRHFPLPQHGNAAAAARAAQAASRQGKFWEMYGLLYDRQSAWVNSSTAPAIFEGYATQLGLNLDQFRRDRDDQALIDQIRRDLGDGNTLQVHGTPTIFLNGEQYTGAVTEAALRQAIDAKLAH